MNKINFNKMFVLLIFTVLLLNLPFSLALEFNQFIMPDLNIPDVYNPQSLNRYSYVLNNPYKYVDPTGNFFETALDIGFISLDIRDIANDPSNWINYAALGGDIAGAATPFLTGVGVGIKAGSKAIKAADKASDVLKTAEGFKSFTKSNFRENLGRISGKELSKTEEAHHVLPVKFEGTFEKAGININDPRFGSIVDKTQHRSFSYQYNKDWETFFAQNKNPSQQQILEKGKELAEKYTFKINYGVSK